MKKAIMPALFALAGKTWTARMENDDETAEIDDVVSVVRIEGVKLIVRKSQ